MTQPGPGGWRRIAINHAGDRLEGWWRFVGERVHLESEYGGATAIPDGAPLEAVAHELLVAVAATPSSPIVGEPEQDRTE